MYPRSQARKNEATIYLAQEVKNGGELENNSEKNE